MKKISKEALYKRVARRLRRDGEYLRTARTWTTDTGWHYVVDDRNCITAGNLNLEQYGRELGVLRADEQIAE